ncbi:MAG: flagellar motor protein MotB [Deltaproteobacteria bacterium]|nr:flagellar motor protein MotB [Myxococcales bacterium]MDP3218774.1 flagellar motor protein MotB [Deltaproteobacteria bacterium]
MGRRKKQAEHVNHERWLISYADFITLLFAFFVVMFSSSQIDQRRLGAFSESFAGATGVTVVPRGSDGLMTATTNSPPAPARREVTNPQVVFSLQDLASTLNRALSRNAGMESVRVIRRRNDFVLRMPENVFFESGDNSVKEGAQVILATLARTLKVFPIDMRVEGHTDANPIRTSRYRSNWELSTARATSVLQVLAGASFPPEQLSASGYGEFHPIATNATDDGRQQNRRVDIVVSIRQSESDDPDEANRGDAAVDPISVIRAQVGAPADAAPALTDASAAVVTDASAAVTIDAPAPAAEAPAHPTAAPHAAPAH